MNNANGNLDCGGNKENLAFSEFYILQVNILENKFIALKYVEPAEWKKMIETENLFAKIR
jgi:hypothetical protein